MKATARYIPEYHDFWRGKVMHGGKKFYGTFFKLSSPLTDETKLSLLESYGNIAFFIGNSQYAPEQKHNIVFCADNYLRRA